MIEVNIDMIDIPLILTDELNVIMPYKWHLIPIWKYKGDINEV